MPTGPRPTGPQPQAHRHTGPQAPKPTGPQAHEPTSPQAHRPTSPQAHMPTGPKAHTPTGTQGTHRVRCSTIESTSSNRQAGRLVTHLLGTSVLIIHKVCGRGAHKVRTSAKRQLRECRVAKCRTLAVFIFTSALGINKQDKTQTQTQRTFLFQRARDRKPKFRNKC